MLHGLILLAILAVFATIVAGNTINSPSQLCSICNSVSKCLSPANLKLSNQKLQELKQNFLADFTQPYRCLADDMKRITTGFSHLMKNSPSTISHALNRATPRSYSDVKRVEETRQGLFAFADMAFWVYMNPRYFIASRFVLPHILPTALPAWPYYFLTPAEKEVAKTSMRAERMSIVMSGLEDVRFRSTHPYLSKFFRCNLDNVDSALKKDSLDESIECLSSWYTKPEKGIRRWLQYDMQIPPSYVSRIVKAFGSRPTFNIPILRKINYWKTSSSLHSVMRIDDFLSRNDMVDKLEPDELKEICFWRCIKSTEKSDDELRKDIKSWLRATSPNNKHFHKSKMLIAMGVEAMKDFVSSKESQLYKNMFTPITKEPENSVKTNKK